MFYKKDKTDIPLLEFDGTKKAMIEPGFDVPKRDVPENCVICFFKEVLQIIARDHGAIIHHVMKEEHGVHPVYEIEHNGKRLAFFHPGVGAPLACGMLEEVIALGCKRFVACGGAGTLEPGLDVGHIIVPVSAVRDEGTSYHYLPPSRESYPCEKMVKTVCNTLDTQNITYKRGKTWTTDAFYRETATRVANRRKEGCLTVEMEASAFFAVAAFRGVSFAQLLYAGDDLSRAEWDSRDWDKNKPIRENLFWLAADCVTQD